MTYDDKPALLTKSSQIAETDLSRVHTVRIEDFFLNNCSSVFKFFLDGSRRTYQIDDIAIGNKIFPVIAGQIVVGCCERKDRDTFKKFAIENKIVLAMPDEFDIDDENKNNNFCRL